VPGYELYKGIDLNKHETIFILGLIPLLAMFIAMESGLLGDYARFLGFPINSHWAITGTYYLLAIAVTAAAYCLVAGIGAAILNVEYKLALRNFGYIFLPFAYMAMIRDIVLTYFFKGSFIPIKFPDFVVTYPFFDIGLMLIGASWSTYMAVKISQVTLTQGNQQPNTGKVAANTFLHLAPIIGLAVYWIGLMLPEYITTLIYYDIYIGIPFVVAFGVIGMFILIARNYGTLKKITEKPLASRTKPVVGTANKEFITSLKQKLEKADKK